MAHFFSLARMRSQEESSSFPRKLGSECGGPQPRGQPCYGVTAPCNSPWQETQQVSVLAVFPCPGLHRVWVGPARLASPPFPSRLQLIYSRVCYVLGTCHALNAGFHCSSSKLVQLIILYIRGIRDRAGMRRIYWARLICRWHVTTAPIVAVDVVSVLRFAEHLCVRIIALGLHNNPLEEGSGVKTRDSHFTNDKYGTRRS